MDSYLADGGLCHPSDNTGAILAASEHADLSGKDFLIALAVAYQVESRLTDAVPFMADGFDLTTPLSFSLAAGVSKALGLDEAKTAAAVGISGDFIHCLLRGPLRSPSGRAYPHLRWPWGASTESSWRSMG
jgi:2-methylcitrate dehydratase